jgi:hypothetical protein
MRTMLLVVDAEGRFVAAAHHVDDVDGETNVGISALPGQTVHKVAVQAALLELPGDELEAAFAHARVEPGTTEVRFPQIETKQQKHRKA